MLSQRIDHGGGGVKPSLLDKAKSHFRSLGKSLSGKSRLTIPEARGGGGGRASPPESHELGFDPPGMGSTTPPPAANAPVFVPDEFRCPISGEIMSDPVIVASGQSYERSCIQAWLDTGSSRCLKSNEELDHRLLIPNVALKTAIFKWSEMFHVPTPQPISIPRARELVQRLHPPPPPPPDSELVREIEELPPVSSIRYVHSASGAALNSMRDEAMEASTSTSTSGNVPHTLDTSPSSLTREGQVQGGEDNMDPREVQILLKKLTKNNERDQADAVRQVRSLARYGPYNRRTLCGSELLEALVRLLQLPFQDLVVNSVAALLNLSLEMDNKLKIVRSGALPHLVHALRSFELELQELAAGVIFSLAQHEENRLAIGVLGSIPPLIDVLRNTRQTPGAQRDASMALYYLSLAQMNKSKMVRAGLVPILVSMAEDFQLRNNDSVSDLASRGMCILSCLAVGSEGRTALLEVDGVTRILRLLKTSAAKGGQGEFNEHAVATLLQLSHHNIRFKHLALQAGGLDVLLSLLKTATPRGEEKIRTLLTVLRDPPAGLSSSLSSSGTFDFPRAYFRRGAQDGAKAESSYF